MARVIALLCLGVALNACDRHIIYCEGPRLASADGECTAQLVQDVSTDGTYAVVECRNWHYAPNPPNWNAVTLKGTQNAVALKWLDSRTVEISVSQNAEVKLYQPSMKGSAYTV